MVSAVYFDGKSAVDQSVTVEVSGSALKFNNAEGQSQTWSISGLHAIDKPAPGQPFRLTHDAFPGERLVIRDADFIAEFVSKNPVLRGGVTGKQVVNVGAWIVGGLSVVAISSYILLSMVPQRVANILPDEWRNRVGAQLEKAIVEDAKVCSNPAGVSALGAMVASISEGSSDLPAIAVKVYDIPIMNAFAAPGDRIIMTKELINTASSAEEVAGVLAHEMGHVVKRHSEAQLVRVTGLQVLLSVVTGTSGGDTVSTVAGLAAILQYSRDAEREADQFAIATLTNAQIDPMGFKKFFEKIMALEGKSSGSALSRVGNMISTHPGTQDRINAIQPLPNGVKPKPPLTESQWQALRKICD